MAESAFNIEGFLSSPPQTAGGKPLLGRFVCPDMQWIGDGSELFGTFTITARELLACADNDLLWTDQDVQRGVRPEITDAPKELSLKNGYPDQEKYVFDGSKSDDICQKLLKGEKLFLNPLIWNLRPSKFEGYYDSKAQDFNIYSGKIYLPDSHHRHQAIVNAARIVRENPGQYKKFGLDKQFKVEVYFLSKEDEGNYFFAKNQLPKPTAKSKAFDLATDDNLSLLAKKFAELSNSLTDNVNRVTDRLASNNADVVTLSTLREMMRTYAGDDVVSGLEAQGIAAMAAEFYDLLALKRPELGQRTIAERNLSRQNLLVDAAVMMHGYAYLMRDFKRDISKLGNSQARKQWLANLDNLNAPYHSGAWAGDYFSKDNPLWLELGILRRKSQSPGLSVVNNGATRAAAGRALRGLLNAVRLEDKY